MSETELISKVLKLKDERTANLEATVAMLAAELERFKGVEKRMRFLEEEVLGKPSTSEEETGEFERWIESDDARQFAYKHIAYVLGEGVIGSADTLDSLVASIAHHPKQNEAILDFVIGDRV